MFNLHHPFRIRQMADHKIKKVLTYPLFEPNRAPPDPSASSQIQEGLTSACLTFTCERNNMPVINKIAKASVLFRILPVT